MLNMQLSKGKGGGGHVVPLSEAAKLELGSGFLGLFPLLAPGQLSLKGREKQVKDVPT